jgi:DNA-binding transcriptional MerR regulator
MTIHKERAEGPDVSQRIYTSVQLMDFAGISLRKVQHWTKHGLLFRMFIATGAHGNRPTCYYSAAQVKKAVLIREMCQRGLPLKAVIAVDTYLKRRGLRLEESGKYLLTNGKTACYASSETEVVEDLLKHKGQMLLIAMYEPLQKIEKQLQSKKVASR